MKTMLIIIITFISTITLAYASQSSVLEPTVSQTASGDSWSCPEGYALHVVKKTTQNNTTKVVTHTCKSLTIFGYEREWCGSEVPHTASDTSSIQHVCSINARQPHQDVVVAGVRA